MLSIICCSFSYLGGFGLVNWNVVVRLHWVVPAHPMLVSFVKVVWVRLSLVACAVRVYALFCVQLKLTLNLVFARTARLGRGQLIFLVVTLYVPLWNTCVALHCWGTVSVMFQSSAVMSPMLVVIRL